MVLLRELCSWSRYHLHTAGQERDVLLAATVSSRGGRSNQRRTSKRDNAGE
jgi:hypothetical protein